MLGLLVGLALAAEPVDLNAADVATLAALPGLGPERAETIVAWRDAHGPFPEVAALIQVPGLSRATTVALSEHLVATGAPRPPAPPARLALNDADADALARLPGLDARLAARIVADRDRNGPFEHCRELARIDGIGPATLAVLGERCTVEAQRPSGAPVPPPR